MSTTDLSAEDLTQQLIADCSISLLDTPDLKGPHKLEGEEVPIIYYYSKLLCMSLETGTTTIDNVRDVYRKEFIRLQEYATNTKDHERLHYLQTFLTQPDDVLSGIVDEARVRAREIRTQKTRGIQ